MRKWLCSSILCMCLGGFVQAASVEIRYDSDISNSMHPWSTPEEQWLSGGDSPESSPPLHQSFYDTSDDTTKNTTILGNSPFKGTPPICIPESIFRDRLEPVCCIFRDLMASISDIAWDYVYENIQPEDPWNEFLLFDDIKETVDLRHSTDDPLSTDLLTLTRMLEQLKKSTNSIETISQSFDKFKVVYHRHFDGKIETPSLNLFEKLKQGLRQGAADTEIFENTLAFQTDYVAPETVLPQFPILALEILWQFEEALKKINSSEGYEVSNDLFTQFLTYAGGLLSKEFVVDSLIKSLSDEACIETWPEQVEDEEIPLQIQWRAILKDLSKVYTRISLPLPSHRWKLSVSSMADILQVGLEAARGNGIFDASVF